MAVPPIELSFVAAIDFNLLVVPKKDGNTAIVAITWIHTAKKGTKTGSDKHIHGGTGSHK